MYQQGRLAESPLLVLSYEGIRLRKMTGLGQEWTKDNPSSMIAA